MTDTSPEIEKKWHEMLMSRSNEERFMMGIRSNMLARQMVIASLPKNLSPAEFKEKLFIRYYDNDFSEAEKKKIIEWIRKNN
jgi:hypothetical protein